jgi:ATP-dependent DNA helicase RecG
VEHDPITGPVPEQIYRTLNFLKDKLVKERVIKPAEKAESIRISSYPYQAIEETLVNAFYHRDYQQREPIEIRIYPDSVIFINHGGPDRSIRMDAFSQGQVRSRRYRNRRLGEFLKELELTEGRSTGIPTILKALHDNESPAPRFHTDNDRTFFEVELFIHPSFVIKAPLIIDLKQMKWDLGGINRLLDQLIDSADGGIAADIAGDIAALAKSIDNHAIDIIDTIDRDIAGDIAGGIAGGIAEKMIRVLQSAVLPVERKDMAKAIDLVNNAKNFNTYIQPLVATNWLTMTIPDKPTSPNQKYLTTLKGRLVLKFLKLSTK